MNFSFLMIINAIVAVVFGVGFVFAPGQTLSYYGISPDAAFRLVAQLFGAALVGFAVLTWSARNAAASEARNAILLALFVSDGIGLILSLIGQIQGVPNALGWLNVAIYLFLTLGFGYFLFSKGSAP
ncbi:MAG: hypothetical protein P8Y68_10300 [Anaerolineales bacterium]|jgi:hypothetical protein